MYAIYDLTNSKKTRKRNRKQHTKYMREQKARKAAENSKKVEFEKHLIDDSLPPPDHAITDLTSMVSDGRASTQEHSFAYYEVDDDAETDSSDDEFDDLYLVIEEDRELEDDETVPLESTITAEHEDLLTDAFELLMKSKKKDKKAALMNFSRLIYSGGSERPDSIQKEGCDVEGSERKSYAG